MDGKLLLFYGPSASGKTSLMNALSCSRIVTVTTRRKRDNEVDGKDYYFWNHEQFEREIENGSFVEWVQYARHYYGTRKEEVQRIIKMNEVAVCILDVYGVKKFKELFPEQTISVNVTISLRCMLDRLKERGSTNEEINSRIREFLDNQSKEEVHPDIELINEGVFEVNLQRLKRELVKKGVYL